MNKDYKETLNLPRTAFPMKANLTKREPEILKFWQEKEIYKRIQEKNKGNPSFILHDGPPYANGHIHIGHALNKVLKDIIVKFYSMRGFYSPYVPGWDCHGLPIELQVDKNLKRKEMDILEKRRACRDYANRFVDIQRKEFIRLGVFGDWSKPYLTMDFSYQAAIVEELFRFLEEGYVYRGKKPVYWCPSCVTALAEAEVEYYEKTSPSIFVSFRVKEGVIEGLEPERPLYIIIWTTTPWTLPANLALAVNPDVTYVVLDTGSEYYLLAEDLLEDVKSRTGLEGKVAKRLKGQKLEGIKAEHPFLKRLSSVVEGEFVTTTEGTGIVHIAPGHGEEDYLVGLRYGLDIYAPVDKYGRFTIEELGLKGKKVFEANKLIIDILRQRGALLGSSEITHSYPHCWRCKKPVIFRATEQWFISVEHRNLRKRCLEEINRVHWIPPWGRERISGMVSQRPDWCISRQRVWGVPIAVLLCKDCGEYVNDKSVFERIVEIFRQRGADAWFELSEKEIIPEGYRCRCGSTRFEKERDILDVWFDSGVSHAAVLEKDPRLIWPSDMYLEGSDQHRGWFQSSLITSVATRNKAPYSIVLTHGFVVDGQGRKMSKSLGNVISSDDIIKQQGAEILRIWVSSEDYRAEVRLSKEILNRIVEAYRKIRNTFRFMLGNLYDYDLKDYREYLLEIDRWIMSRLQGLVKQTREAYERFDFHEVFHRIYNFCVVDLSAFYLDILKDRLYVSKAESPERRAAQWCIYQILNVLTKLLAPILSFTAEEVWQHTPGHDTESVFLSDFPEVQEEFLDEDLEKRWEMLIKAREAVNKALEIKRAEKFIGNSLEAKVTVYADGEPYELLSAYREFLPTLFIVSEVEVKERRSPAEGAYLDEKTSLVVKVEKASGQKCQRCWNWDASVGTLPDPLVCERCYRVLSER